MAFKRFQDIFQLDQIQKAISFLYYKEALKGNFSPGFVSLQCGYYMQMNNGWRKSYPD